MQFSSPNAAKMFLKGHGCPPEIIKLPFLSKLTAPMRNPFPHGQQCIQNKAQG